MTRFRASPELEALISLLRWPPVTVKWWVAQELAALLLDATQRQAVESALLAALEASQSELEAAELLLVFWLAMSKDASFARPTNLAVSIKARSPLSDAILRSLGGDSSDLGAYLTPLTVVPKFMPDPTSLVAMERQAFPHALRSTLELLQDRSGFPMEVQFAYEWETSCKRVPDHAHRIDFFLEERTNQFTGQFCTEQSYRGRSAFLRAVAVAAEAQRWHPRVAEWASETTLPLNPTLAWVRSGPPSPSLAGPLVVPEGQSEEDHIKDVVRRLSQTGVLGAASWIARAPNGVEFDCRAALWEGAASGLPVEVVPKEVAEFDSQILRSERLDRVSTYHCSKESVTEGPAGYRRLACLLLPHSYGYMQADLMIRGIFAPIAPDETTRVLVAPQGDQVSFRVNDVEIGRFGYWNIAWRSSYRRLGGPGIGTYLHLSQVGANAFYVWHCKRISQMQRYGDDEASDLYGSLPLSRLARAAR